MRRNVGSVAVISVLALLTGCGSTISAQRLEASSGSGAFGTGQTAATPGTATDAGGVAQQAGAAGTGSAAASGPGGTAADGTNTDGSTVPADTAQTGAAAGLPASGPGWTATTVSIGFVTQKDVQKAFSSVGVSGYDAGDQEAEAQAVIDGINARGGLFGRKLVPVFRDVSTVQAAEDPTTVGQAVCTYFTQDHKVIGVISPVTLIDYPGLRTCMKNGHVPLLSATAQTYDDALGKSLAPYWYQLVAPDWDTLAPALISTLKSGGWFGGWNASTGSAGPGRAKVGIFHTDDADGTFVAKLLEQQLSKLGYTDTVDYGYTAGSTNSFSPAVLKFQGSGVTHVIVPNVDLLGFELNAQNQHYKPRYAITTYNAPYSNLQSTAPKGSNNGAMGLGWAPSLDVDAANDPGPTPGAAQCRAEGAKLGLNYNTKRLAQSVEFAFCDGVNLIVDGAKAGGGFSAAQIMSGALRIASSFTSALSFGTGLAPGHYYVPGRARPLVWVNSCSCLRYLSGSVKL